MKHDKNKLQAINFYWDGLAKLVDDRHAKLINAYQQFSQNPSIDTLKLAFDALKALNVPHIDEIVARIYDHGAQKYGDKNYLGLTIDRFIPAMGRHLRAAIISNQLDESGELHIGHVLANILISAELID